MQTEESSQCNMGCRLLVEYFDRDFLTDIGLGPRPHSLGLIRHVSL